MKTNSKNTIPEDSTGNENENNEEAHPVSMRRNFSNRAELIDYLKQEFPSAAAINDHVTDTQGGRKAAEARLKAINPEQYGRTRNHLDGAVTGLSPYLRHGVLSLAEVRDAVFEAVDEPEQAFKLIQELAWRDYYQRVYNNLGLDIWEDQEAYKTGFEAEDYAKDLPEDISAGETGLLCIDSFVQQLEETGYLHNHARMWVAGYVVHWRRVRWQAGARWFLTHLLDGDPASNNLSWQWIASTFSHKPYFFNRENVEKFTQGQYCKDCPLYGHCDFEGTYPEVEARLFPHKPPKPTP